MVDTRLMKVVSYLAIVIGLVVALVAGAAMVFRPPAEPPLADPVTFVPAWEPPPPVVVEPERQEILPEEQETDDSIGVATPAHIVVESIGVDHPVVEVGLLNDGRMEIPESVHELGWYEPGVAPGELGSAVIAGHVDSREQGPGALFDLRLIQSGDEIRITDHNGIERVWVVTDVTRFNKEDTPMDQIFRWGGDSTDLVLVTCGGEFDRTQRSYEDNIVVYAAPQPG